jgi:hypothetical protein
MVAIAAIMVAILVAIFNMVAKTHKKFRSAPMLTVKGVSKRKEDAIIHTYF